jgi:hypothetical protein
MITFIKIFGPPVLKAIRALELIAVSMPEVRIMDTIIVQGLPKAMSRDVARHRELVVAHSAFTPEGE